MQNFAKTLPSFLAYVIPNPQPSLFPTFPLPQTCDLAKVAGEMINTGRKLTENVSQFGHEPDLSLPSWLTSLEVVGAFAALDFKLAQQCGTAIYQLISNFGPQISPNSMLQEQLSSLSSALPFIAGYVLGFRNVPPPPSNPSAAAEAVQSIENTINYGEYFFLRPPPASNTPR
jgi:hypothetical protein